jgi:hypothetical protein
MYTACRRLEDSGPNRVASGCHDNRTFKPGEQRLAIIDRPLTA